MTENGFMTDEAWDELAEDLARGIRALPIIKDHPTWWVFFTLDGFHAHKMTLKAQLIFAKYLLMILIEEGDSSHVNQTFDRFVARCGKSCMRECLELLNDFNLGDHMNQWGLIPVALEAFRLLQEKPSIVVASFKATNMLFSCRLGLPQWLMKIKGFLERGAKFKDEGVITPKMLLPDWHTDTSESTRAEAIEVVKSGGGWGDVEMCEKLLVLLKIPVGNLPKHQTCHFVETTQVATTAADPEQPPASTSTPGNNTIVFDTNEDLRSYMLHPATVEHNTLEHFSHICRFAARRTLPVKTVHAQPALSTLDLAVGTRVEHWSGQASDSHLDLQCRAHALASLQARD